MNKAKGLKNIFYFFLGISIFISGEVIGSEANIKRLLNTNICPKCSLISADLTGNFLEGADLTGANLSKANFFQKIKDRGFDSSFKKKQLDLYISIPLVSSSPTEQEIKFLIESWLKGKAEIFNGIDSEILIYVARTPLINKVIEERKKDNLLDQRQIIDAKITSINIIKTSTNRIVADVELNYKGKKINSSGQILSESVFPSLKVKYIIGRKKGTWKLVDYISMN